MAMKLDYDNPMHRQSQRPKNLRTVIGWSVGGLIALLVLAMVLVPNMGRAREPANRIKCASNLRQIGQAAYLYANGHGGQLPPDLATILESQNITADALVCASSDVEKATG